MSLAKYAGLPDIDTAPDVYESADVAPAFEKQESSSEEAIVNTPSKHTPRKKRRDDTPRATKEELDQSSLMTMEQAGKKFKRAERRARTLYVYPSSPTSSNPPSPSSPTNKKKTPLSTRLAHLRAEISTLEAEITDPSNPLVIADEVNPGDLMRGLLDVQRRLEGIKRGVGGRGALVGKLVSGEREFASANATPMSPKVAAATTRGKQFKSAKEENTLADMDKRLKELESVLGSSSTSLDDTNPLPPPLLPMVTKLSSQLTILTQPRHIDSISRRLKLLLSDLDRMGGTSNVKDSQQGQDDPGVSSEANPLKLQEQILPLLARLSPHIPQIPLILTRLRTLSALHTSASSFDETLAGLEEEQRDGRKGLDELSRAVEVIEKRMAENQKVTSGNVKGLEERVESVGERLKRFES